MQKVLDAIANGMRVMAKMLNAAAISNDMKPGQVRDLAEKCNYGVESSTAFWRRVWVRKLLQYITGDGLLAPGVVS